LDNKISYNNKEKQRGEPILQRVDVISQLLIDEDSQLHEQTPFGE